MRELEVGIGMRQLWSWLAESESEPTEQPLALARPNGYFHGLRQEG
jgi:hypothetical protein